MPGLDKQLICERFRRSLESYDRSACVQNAMAERLLGRILGVWPAGKAGRGLEIGCGTGGLTRRLTASLPFRHLWLNDLVPDCASRFADLSGTTFLAGDIEEIALPDELDLVASNAVFQWLDDLPWLLRRIRHALRPQGLLAFTTFGPDNLREIRQLAGSGLDYLPLAELSALVARDFTLLAAEETRAVLDFAEPREVLGHLKDTGVTATGRVQAAWTRPRLHDFSAGYQREYSLPDGRVSLTYHPIFILAKAP